MSKTNILNSNLAQASRLLRHPKESFVEFPKENIFFSMCMSEIIDTWLTLPISGSYPEVGT